MRQAQAERYEARDLGFVAITAAAVITLLLLHAQVWTISPSRDDYMPPLAEVHRGMAEGPWSFFVEPSSFPSYRPLTFLSTWLAGTISMERIVTIVHGFHFFWVAACLGVLALWARTLDFSRFAFAFGALVLVAHPVLAGPLASVDGFPRLASTAWTWLGAWFVLRSARGSLGGDLAAAACLAVGLGFAEYALGLVPLALLAVLWRRQSGRSWASIVRLAALLGTVSVGWYVLRTGVLGVDAAAAVAEVGDRYGALTRQPAVWLLNAGQLVAITLFWGNSVWTMLGPQPWAKAVTAGALVLALAWLAGGLARSAPERPCTPRGWLARADTGLLVPAALAATFPMVLMGHVSELYATPVLMSVALLAGGAADGWRRASRALRRLAFAAAAAAVLVGLWASWAKIEGVALAGQQSDEQLYQVLGHIPPDARGWRIATVFVPADPQPTYSVFAPWRGDWEIVRTDTLRWFRPGQELNLDRLMLPEACERADDSFDLILRWDRPAASYRPLESLEAFCRNR